MNFRITWPRAIVLSLVAFIIFILNFVFQSFFDDKLAHHLVSDDYYKDEIYYQDEINQLNRAAALKQDLKLIATDKGLEFVFPEEMNTDKIALKYWFQRNDQPNLDLKAEFSAGSIPVNEYGSYFIDSDLLVKGKYQARIHWEYQDSLYLFKKDIYY
ncbi:MAG: FixH family protein [Flavobacteriaceae bacterium]